MEKQPNVVGCQGFLGGVTYGVTRKRARRGEDSSPASPVRVNIYRHYLKSASMVNGIIAYLDRSD